MYNHFRIFLSFSAVVIACLFTTSAWAVPAAPITVTLEQPDGTTFEAKQWGDEFYNGMETLDGYTVVKKAGTWFYARKAADGSLAASPDSVGSLAKDALAQLPKHLRPDVDPSVIRRYDPRRLGKPAEKVLSHTQYVLTILVDYRDISFTYLDPTFQALIYGASSSVKDFFLDNSYNNFTVTPASESYDTANDGIVHINRSPTDHPDLGSGDWRTEARNIVSASDGSVDYATFDSDADGSISVDELSIVIILAGYENSYGGASAYTPRVWGHKWSFSSLTLDGKTLSPYTMFGERHRSTPGNQHQATIGIMCHEMGHLMLGEPDLYDTDGGSEGIGDWGLMGGGSWNMTGAWSGDSPAHLSAFCKALVDMTTPSDIMSAATSVNILKGDSNADIKRLWYDKYRAREYFLVENRQQSGYDTGLPSNGLMIWHVDDWLATNTDETHKWVDVEAADGFTHLDAETNQGDPGDPYPGSSTNRTFNNGSNPNSKDYNNVATGIAVVNISNSGSTMTADFTPNGTGGTGDSIRYDEENKFTGSGLNYGSTTWTAVRYTNTTSMNRLEGFDVYVNANATIDFYLYHSIPSNTPTTLLHSQTGFSASAGWNRCLLATPQLFPASADRVIVLKIVQSGTATAYYDGWGTIDDRSWIDNDGSGPFWRMHTGDDYPGDLNQIALLGSSSSTVIYVDFDHAGIEAGTQTYPYNTFGEGVAGVAGGTIKLKGNASDTQSSWTGTLGSGNVAMIIQSDPAGSVRIGVTGAGSSPPEAGSSPPGAKGDRPGNRARNELEDLLRMLQSGVAGVGRVSSEAADKESDEESTLGAEGMIHEPVMPFSEAGKALKKAQPDSVLAIRLRSEAGVDPDSIWAPGPDDAASVEWMPVQEGDLRDVWVLFKPHETWYLEDVITLTAGAETATGEPVGPETYLFQVESEEEQAEAIWQPQYGEDYVADRLDLTVEGADTAVVTLAGQTPPLAEAVEAPFAIRPEQVYDTPQCVWLPIPPGVDAGAVQLYYYHATGEDQGWYPAENVEGWLVPDSYLHIEVDGTTYLGFLVRHAGIVQLGIPLNDSE